MGKKWRGSRKHILDWTGLSPEIFASDITDLVSLCGFSVTPDDCWMPRGHQATVEAKLDAYHIPFLDPKQKERLRAWWLKHTKGANVPNWDLVSTCTTNDQRKGLILIEAKAHHNELKRKGKSLAKGASEDSKANHDHIGQAIAAAGKNLCEVIGGVNICRNRNYQLANRVATSAPSSLDRWAGAGPAGRGRMETDSGNGGKKSCLASNILSP